MSNTTKIELAIQDLFVALDERATNKANLIASRLEFLSSRVEKLESAGSAGTALTSMVDELRTMNRRIADLESVVKAAHRRIDELENVAEEDPRAIIADMINDGDIRLHID